MGKGKIPDKKDDGESVKLKPIPDKQVNIFLLLIYDENDDENFVYAKILMMT